MWDPDAPLTNLGDEDEEFGDEDELLEDEDEDEYENENELIDI